MGSAGASPALFGALAEKSEECPARRVTQRARLPRSPDQLLAAREMEACPRRNSDALIRRLPSNCTSLRERAPLPAAITSSFSPLKICPGLPLRSTTDAENIFRFRPSMVINAPGHGLKARIFFSITPAGSYQSILPFSRFSFGAD